MNLDQVAGMVGESSRVIGGLREDAAVIAAMGKGLVACLGKGGTVFTAGNGGSASEALHMAEELTGRYKGNRRPLPAVALVADATALTCIANDFGFENVFSRQLLALGRPGDFAVFFTTSGKSENILKALAVAKERKINTICLLGKDGGAMAGKCDHEIIIRSESTARIQEAHQVIMHVLLEIIEESFG